MKNCNNKISPYKAYVILSMVLITGVLQTAGINPSLPRHTSESKILQHFLSTSISTKSAPSDNFSKSSKAVSEQTSDDVYFFPLNDPKKAHTEITSQQKNATLRVFKEEEERKKGMIANNSQVVEPDQYGKESDDETA